jgi:hypothetical protein
VIDYKRNCLSNFSFYLSGNDFPNGGQKTEAIATFNEKKFNAAGMTTATWDFDNILKNQNKITAYYRQDFYNHHSPMIKKTTTTWHISNESNSLVRHPMERRYTQLVYEFSLLRDENAARMKISKNGSTILDTAFFFSEEFPDRWEYFP